MNPAKIDRQLTFDRLTNVHYSGTRHAEDQPSHLIVHDTDICRTRCREEYGNPCTRFCPANVYEMVDAGDGTQDAADQRVELRALQDVRHHGPVPDHRLGAARRRRRAAVRRHVRRRVPDLAASATAAAQGRGRSRAVGVSARRGARPHADAGGSTAPSTSTRSVRAGPAADHRVLARPHPAGLLLLPRPRHRRHHQPEFRRRVDCADHRRGSASARRAARRRAAGRARWCSCGASSRRAGRSAFTVDGPRGPARVAQPGAVWLAGATGHPVLPFHIEASRAWTTSQLGSHADPEAVQPRSRVVDRRADARRRTPTTRRSRPRRVELERTPRPTLEVRAPGDCCSRRSN